MNYCFDIDGTLCSNTNGDYERAQVFKDRVARINHLYDSGHRIVLHTARGSTTGMDWRDLTENQLRLWGVKYHELLMGKPQADVYIDDKAENLSDWMKRPSPSVLSKPVYLDVTYSQTRAPYGRYPFLLCQWLHENVLKRPGHLLDIGCGRAEHLAGFSELGYDVAGVDISPRAPELAKGYTVCVSDLEREAMPYPSNTFDFVFNKSVIEHMRQPTLLMAKAFEVMRPGGVAVFMTPSWEYNYWGPFYIDHTHVTPFTATSLADALAMAGYEDVKVSYFYQLPFLWRWPFLKLFVRLIAAFPLPYRPYRPAPWPDALNKLIRFSKEVMLLGVGKRPK